MGTLKLETGRDWRKTGLIKQIRTLYKDTGKDGQEALNPSSWGTQASFVYIVVKLCPPPVLTPIPKRSFDPCVSKGSRRRRQGTAGNRPRLRDIRNKHFYRGREKTHGRRGLMAGKR